MQGGNNRTEKTAGVAVAGDPIHVARRSGAYCSARMAAIRFGRRPSDLGRTPPHHSHDSPESYPHNITRHTIRSSPRSPTLSTPAIKLSAAVLRPRPAAHTASNSPHPPHTPPRRTDNIITTPNNTVFPAATSSTAPTTLLFAQTSSSTGLTIEFFGVKLNQQPEQFNQQPEQFNLQPRQLNLQPEQLSFFTERFCFSP